MPKQMEGIIGKLTELASLDFAGKGEAFVESRYLTPLLLCLGYEEYKDYEVLRHGDDGTNFKLRYPPVEKGAVKVKHYNPDFMPTIRKKVFWIIEAKSAKDVEYPFAYSYVVQGLQYCIHPEIQAKYLIVSNGLHTSIYDSHGAVFLGQNIFEPIMTFKSTDILSKWHEIYQLLSVETLRTRIEDDLRKMYEKLCMSSLDKQYPDRLIHTIGISRSDLSQQIAREVIRLNGESISKSLKAHQNGFSSLSLENLFAMMNFPLGPGECAGQHFFERCIKEGKDIAEVFKQLTYDFAVQSIFRKEHTFVAVCLIYKTTQDSNLKALAKSFLDEHKSGKLSILNRAECASIRMIRKLLIIKAFPEIRKTIKAQLESAPEIMRFVQPPTVLDYTSVDEIIIRHETFTYLRNLSGNQLQTFTKEMEQLEASMEQEFKQAASKVTSSEHELNGFVYYGKGGIHWAFRNILDNFDCGDL